MGCKGWSGECIGLGRLDWTSKLILAASATVSHLQGSSTTRKNCRTETALVNVTVVLAVRFVVTAFQAVKFVEASSTFVFPIVNPVGSQNSHPERNLLSSAELWAESP
jgi:hypothetical protein